MVKPVMAHVFWASSRRGLVIPADGGSESPGAGAVFDSQEVYAARVFSSLRQKETSVVRKSV